MLLFFLLLYVYLLFGFLSWFGRFFAGYTHLLHSLEVRGFSLFCSFVSVFYRFRIDFIIIIRFSFDYRLLLSLRRVPDSCVPPLLPTPR